MSGLRLDNVWKTCDRADVWTIPQAETGDKNMTLGRLPPHIWEDFPYILEVFPGMGTLPISGKTSHIWEDFLFV